MFNRTITYAWVFGSFLAIGSSASALVVSGGTGNTTAPADLPGWADVGNLNGSTCVYLGDGWVLTAGHVGPGNPVFGGIDYTWNGVTRQIHDPASPSTNADLIMFQLTTDPVSLPALTIGSAAPPVDAQITAVGCGFSRAASETWWNSSWQEQTGTPAYAGFNWNTSDSSKRWGTANVAGSARGDDGTGTTTDFLYTIFSSTGGSNAMQAATHDSGSAVFYKSGSQWELSGIILAVATYSGQPADTAVYGDATYFADLSQYAPQIDAVLVPEPSSLVLLAAGAAGLWIYRARGDRRLRSGSFQPYSCLLEAG